MDKKIFLVIVFLFSNILIQDLGSDLGVQALEIQAILPILDISKDNL